MFPRSFFSLLLLAFLVLMPSDRAWASSDKVSRLLELARLEFGIPNKAEQRLFEAVANGTVADYSAKEKEHNDLASADMWDGHRVIKASRIIWLCNDSQASLLATHRGISIKGARIDEKLDLRFAQISFPLVFDSCSILAGIDLESAEASELDFPGTHIGPIKADGMKVKRHVSFGEDFEANGEVRLLGATIGGNLQCRNAHFKNEGAKALSADQIEVNGSVFFDEGFRGEGEVRLPHARIGGNLDCAGGQFLNKGGTALFADEAKIVGTVSLKDSKAEGEVRLLNASVGGNLECDNGKFVNEGTAALNLEGLKVKGCVFLRNGFRSQGVVNLLEAKIDRQLNCSGGQFLNKGAIALNANWSRHGSTVFLCDDFKAEGAVKFRGAQIRGNLWCSKSEFLNEKGVALKADSINIGGGIFFNSFRADGEVRLHSATLEGNLEFHKGCLNNKDGTALNAEGLKVGGAIMFRDDFKAAGIVRLHGATIGSNLECGGNSQLMNKGKITLHAEHINVHGSVFFVTGFRSIGKVVLLGATIDNSFVWRGVASPEQVALDLRSARIGKLLDESASWPGRGRLFLDGLVYNEIDAAAPTDAKTRIDWLSRQPAGHFWPQPYEQVAAVLRKRGNDEDAKEILIQKNKDRATFTQLTFYEWLWFKIFGPMIGYGYEPWRAFWIGLLTVLIGSVLFKIGFRADLMTPITVERDAFKGSRADSRSSDHYPRFNSLMYSLDTFIPLIDLQVARYWLPNTNRRLELSKMGGIQVRPGSLIRVWQWFQILAGWVLTTLLIAGLTGMVRS